MKPTERLQDLGQSLWLDNLTRKLLVEGTLKRYAREFSVTGLTSNHTTFERAIREGQLYDDQVLHEAWAGRDPERILVLLRATVQPPAEAAPGRRVQDETTLLAETPGGAVTPAARA